MRHKKQDKQTFDQMHSERAMNIGYRNSVKKTSSVMSNSFSKRHQPIRNSLYSAVIMETPEQNSSSKMAPYPSDQMANLSKESTLLRTPKIVNQSEKQLSDQ